MKEIFGRLEEFTAPVYLEVVPQTFIDRIAIDAKADGSFLMNVFAMNISAGNTLEAQVKKLNGENVGKPFSLQLNKRQDSFTLKSKFDHPLLWNPEFPNLYKVVVSETKAL